MRDLSKSRRMFGISLSRAELQKLFLPFVREVTEQSSH